GQLARRWYDLALGVHPGGLGEAVRELGAVRAGVHVHAAAHGPGDAPKALDAGEPRLRGAAGKQRRRHPGSHDRRRTLHFEAVETFPDANHDAREARVLYEHVRAQAERHPWDLPVLRELERLAYVIGVGGCDEVARRPADPVRGVRGERLVLEHPPTELGLRSGRRGRGRRLVRGFARLRRRLGRSLRWARTAAFTGPGGWFSASVLCCHSWIRRSVPVRVRVGG